MPVASVNSLPRRSRVGAISVAQTRLMRRTPAALGCAGGMCAPYPAPVFDERPRHADAVFELREAVVVRRGGRVDAGGEIIFVGQVHAGACRARCRKRRCQGRICAMTRARELWRAAFDFVRMNATRDTLLGRHGGADRDNRDVLHRRMQRRQVADRAVERVAVVDAGAEHDLRVRLDAERAEPAQLLADIGRGLVAEQIAPQLGLRRMHRDVDRREPLLFEPLPVVLGEVRERDEVAVEEAQPVVVVFHVERLPHALRVALEEAEEAAVVADPDAVERRRPGSRRRDPRPGASRSRRAVVSPPRTNSSSIASSAARNWKSTASRSCRPSIA